MNLETTNCKLCGATDVHFLFCLEDFFVVKCRRCDIVFLPTQINKHEIEAIYNSDYYQSRHDYYFRNPVMNPSFKKESTNIQNFRYGLSLIEKSVKSGRLLDVGCAIGVFLSLAKDNGWEVHGVDISEYAVSRCCEVLGSNAVAGDLKEARFPDRCFDVITLWDVIEHFIDPDEQLKEINRVLKNNGIILLDTPNEDGLLRLIARLIFYLSKGRISYPIRKLYHQFHLYYFTTETLQRLLGKNGFSLIHLEKKSIPLLKARGRFLERLLVKAVSFPEKILRREYELLAIAQKVNIPNNH